MRADAATGLQIDAYRVRGSTAVPSSGGRAWWSRARSVDVEPGCRLESDGPSHWDGDDDHELTVEVLAAAAAAAA